MIRVAWISPEASAVTTVKLATWIDPIVAADGVVFFFGVLFIAWRAWVAFQQASRKLESIDRSMQSITVSLSDSVTSQLRQQELTAIQSQVSPVAMNIVVGDIEIFDAVPGKDEIGIAVFTVRNVGNESVFVLGATRTAEAGCPRAGDACSPRLTGVMYTCASTLTTTRR